MKKLIIIFLFGYFLLCLFFSKIDCVGAIIYTTYVSKKLKITLFSGLLTVGAFLLSMKTFIVFRLKEDLYDNESFKKKIKAISEVTGHEHDHYCGLRNLSNFLSISVFGALSSAVMNITIGFCEKKITSIICVTMSMYSVIFLFCAWILVWKNLNDWFDVLKDS